MCSCFQLSTFTLIDSVLALLLFTDCPSRQRDAAGRWAWRDRVSRALCFRGTGKQLSMWPPRVSRAHSKRWSAISKPWWYGYFPGITKMFPYDSSSQDYVHMSAIRIHKSEITGVAEQPTSTIAILSSLDHTYSCTISPISPRSSSLSCLTSLSPHSPFTQTEPS